MKQTQPDISINGPALLICFVVIIGLVSLLISGLASIIGFAFCS